MIKSLADMMWRRISYHLERFLYLTNLGDPILFSPEIFHSHIQSRYLRIMFRFCCQCPEAYRQKLSVMRHSYYWKQLLPGKTNPVSYCIRNLRRFFFLLFCFLFGLLFFCFCCMGYVALVLTHTQQASTGLNSVSRVFYKNSPLSPIVLPTCACV